MLTIPSLILFRASCLGALVAAALVSPFDPAEGQVEPGPVEESADLEEPTGLWMEARRAGDWHGGNGGSWFTLKCAPGQVAVGVRGRSGTLVDQLTLICAVVLDNGALGSQYEAGTVGGSGGSPFSLKCANQFALESIYGRSGSRLDQIGIRCSTIKGTDSYVGGNAGGQGGAEFWDPAAPNEFVTSIVGRSGKVIDAIQVHYSRF